MWRYPNAEPPPAPAPNQHRNDIRRTKIRHGLYAITIRAKFVELSRKPEFYILAVGLRTSAGVRRDLDIFVDGSDWQGSADLRRPNGSLVKCAASHRINYTREVIRLRVPRSCLKDPRWVQTNLFNRRRLRSEGNKDGWRLRTDRSVRPNSYGPSVSTVHKLVRNAVSGTTRTQ
jgi:hypothetical protein